MSEQDVDILHRIEGLVEEEHAMRSGGREVDPGRLRHVEEQLDQCWDLLRQRQARREAGADPDQAQPRPVAEVEGYLQ
jgi:hypothetical protein